MSTKKLIIFGFGDMARMAYWYFSADSDYQVKAFSVTKQFMNNQNTFCDLPLIPFEEIEILYPPEEYSMFIAMGYKNLNKDRARFYYLAKEKNYKLATYISSKSKVNTNDIGDNCFIFENTLIEPFAKIGNNVIIWSSGQVSHDTIIDDHCFLAPRVAIAGRSHIGSYTFIGINATITDHVRVQKNCMIGAGALVTKDTSPGCVYKMHPAELSRISSDKVRI